MKKILFILLLTIPFVGFGQNPEFPNVDFRGVWEDNYGNFTMIWINQSGGYEYVYMDGYREITEMLTSDRIGDKLVVETIYHETNWKVKYVLSIINEDKMKMEFVTSDGSQYEYILRRVSH